MNPEEANKLLYYSNDNKYSNYLFERFNAGDEWTIEFLHNLYWMIKEPLPDATVIKYLMANDKCFNKYLLRNNDLKRYSHVLGTCGNEKIIRSEIDRRLHLLTGCYCVGLRFPIVISDEFLEKYYGKHVILRSSHIPSIPMGWNEVMYHIPDRETAIEIMNNFESLYANKKLERYSIDNHVKYLKELLNDKFKE